MVVFSDWLIPFRNRKLSLLLAERAKENIWFKLNSVDGQNENKHDLRVMPCLHLSFYQGKNLLRSSYLTLVHSSSVYIRSNNSS